MKKKYLISIFFIFIAGKSLFSQKKSFKLYSNDSIENSILKRLSITIEEEITKEQLSKKLQLKGFIYNSIDSVIKNNKEQPTIYYISLREKIDSLYIKVPTTYNYLKKEIPILNKRTIKTKFNQFENIINQINKYFTEKGRTFSTIKLIDIDLSQNRVTATLSIQESKKRTIDKIIVKGYEDFPKSYLKHFLKINLGDIFNKNKINLTSKNINNLSFAKTIKPPEALFKRDSTSIYLYINKVKKNNFDGLLNFSTSPTNKNLLITGNLNLELINLLNTGEELNFSWNANGNESQNINLRTKIPYLFNSPISNKTAFEIHKQDSTFLNSKFKTNLLLNLNPNNEIGIFYETENSNNTLKNQNISVSNFESSFIGINYNYTKPNDHPIFDTKPLLQTQYQFGRRKTESQNSNQNKLNIEAHYIFDINPRNSIFIQNQTGFLFSDSYLANELFRIGGPNSIRGYNQESIFSSKYSFFNLEYRILTNYKSYIYTITDIGISENIEKTRQDLLSIGAGYSFLIKQSKIDLIFSGNLNNTETNNKGFNLAISFKNYF